MSDDQLTQTERLTRGIQAETELQLTQRAFDATRTALLEAIAASNICDTALREQLYLSVGVLEKVRALLVDCINDGALARNEIEVARHFQTQAEGRVQ